MRAAVLRDWRAPPDVMDIDDPEARHGAVVLKVLACGVCRSDWHAWTGSDPDINLPQVLGHEFCGEVVAVGAGVTGWRVEDRVIAPFILACGRCGDCAAGNQTICADQVVPGFTCAGAFAEYVAVPYADANLTALPDDMAPEVAAALGCRVTTAWHALTGRAQLQAGEWLAIIGGGGIGISALLLGRALGARVIVVDVVAEKLLRDRKPGPDPELEDLKNSIRDIGLSNPIRVEPREDGRFELVQGMRRLTAYRELLQETGDAQFRTIPAGIVPAGDPLETSYRRMVDENMIRKDISFAEMGLLARAYAEDPNNECKDIDKAVAVLFKSASYTKRSYIRAFAALMMQLGKVLEQDRKSVV